MQLQTGFVATRDSIGPVRVEAADARRRSALRGAAASSRAARPQNARAAGCCSRRPPLQASFAGERGRSDVIELAERAWDERPAARAATAHDGIALDARRRPRSCLSRRARARRSRSPTPCSTDARRRASPLRVRDRQRSRGRSRGSGRGGSSDALADLELGRDARRYGWRQFARAAAANYCLCLIEVGELDRGRARC